MIVYNYNLYILLSKILFYIVSNIKIYDIVQIEKKNERRINKKIINNNRISDQFNQWKESLVA